MRLIIDSLIALMVVAILAVISLNHRHKQMISSRIELVHRSLDQLQHQTVYHGALGDVEVNRHGFPQMIEPTWFEDGLPLNVLAPGPHPWLDLAPPGDLSAHPPDPVLASDSQAGFWYNPNVGIFRARVRAELTDAGTLDAYNRVNRTGLSALPSDLDPVRLPLSPPAGTATPPEPLTATAGRSRPTLESMGEQAAAEPEPAPDTEPATKRRSRPTLGDP